jgi:hypothetical protein
MAAPLTKKQRQALPDGLPLSAHDKLLEKFGILALFHLVHPDGDRSKLDPLRQFADCQVNLVPQKDLYEAFNDWFDDDRRKDRILELLANFERDHTGANAMKLNALRNMADVLDKAPWNKELVKFCGDFAAKNAKAYRINQFGFTFNTDVTLFRDVGHAIANWTCDYHHNVYDDKDIGKPKADVNVWQRRPFLKKEASELARAYMSDRLLECTSDEYRNTPEAGRLRPWSRVADQVHALLPRIVSTMGQKNGPEVELGSLLLEAAAWAIVNLHDGHPIVFNIRRREMTPIAVAPEPEPTGEDDEVASDTDSEGGKPLVDKTYRTTEVLTLIAVPNKDRTDYVFRDSWPASVGNITNSFAELISYYDKGQEGTGLDSSDDAEYKEAVMKISPFFLMLPMLVAHPPHPGLAKSNDPKWSLYEKVSPPHQPLEVSRMRFQGWTLGVNDPDRKQASINDWVIYGTQLAVQHNQAETREYTFFIPGQCMTLRKETLDAAPRHLLMASLNEASRMAKNILALQKKADATGAVAGGFGIRITNMVLPAMTKAEGDQVAAIKQPNTRLNKYKEVYPNNKAFYELLQ